MTKYFKVSTVGYYGIGRDTVVKGSNVIDSSLQEGQITFDLYCPVIKSTIIDWFLCVWATQLSNATYSSFLLLLSTD